MRIHDPDFLAELEKAIAVVEKKTSGELVVSIVKKSSSYPELTFVAALVGWISATVILAPFWHLGLSAIVSGQIVGLALFSLLSLIPFFRRKCLPPFLKKSRVHDMAREVFWDAGLTETRERIGVLILVSLLERSVEILADKGIHSRLGHDYWKREVTLIRDGFRTGNQNKALLRAIHDIGDKLIEYFPRRADDGNELSNRIRTDD